MTPSWKWTRPIKNTKASKKYKITIDESAEEVEKAKTTINTIVTYYHDEGDAP